MSHPQSTVSSTSPFGSIIFSRPFPAFSHFLNINKSYQNHVKHVFACRVDLKKTWTRFPDDPQTPAVKCGRRRIFAIVYDQLCEISLNILMIPATATHLGDRRFKEPFIFATVRSLEYAIPPRV